MLFVPGPRGGIWSSCPSSQGHHVTGRWTPERAQCSALNSAQYVPCPMPARAAGEVIVTRLHAPDGAAARDSPISPCNELAGAFPHVQLQPLAPARGPLAEPACPHSPGDTVMCRRAIWGLALSRTH